MVEWGVDGNHMRGKCNMVWCCIQDLKNMDADVIFSKQLKQIEKEKRDKEMKLKSQEKKVSQPGDTSRETGDGGRVPRWISLSVPSAWWSCLCWRNNMRSSKRRTRSSTQNRRTKRWALHGVAGH